MTFSESRARSAPSCSSPRFCSTKASPFGGNMPDRNVKLLFALFALSGFTGLIYESVWSHYLKLFLGAAAFAQSFVLAAFMGGMALGAWLASRWSARLKNLLAAYGWIEAAIGVAALVFHESYLLLTQFSLDQVLPALGSPGAVEIYKYSLCAVLIVPQTLLLGMTFPLLSAAVPRRAAITWRCSTSPTRSARPPERSPQPSC